MRNILVPFCSVLIFLSAVRPLLGKTIHVTRHSIIEVKAADFGLEVFEKKPVIRLLGENGEKVTLKVMLSSRKFRSEEVDSINCMLKRPVATGDYDLIWQARRVDEALHSINQVRVVAPTINHVSPNRWGDSDSITISGQFFGKKPKVMISRQIIDKEGNVRIRKVRAKLVEESLGYMDESGRENLSSMHLRNGVSRLKVQLSSQKRSRLRRFFERHARASNQNDNSFASTQQLTVANGSGVAIRTVSDQVGQAGDLVVGFLYQHKLQKDAKSDVKEMFKASGLQGELVFDICELNWLFNPGFSSDKFKYGFDVWRVVYLTTLPGESELINASALVLVPTDSDKTPLANCPLVSYQHGTLLPKGAAPGSAYSLETGRAALFAAMKGCVVVIPDYSGMGFSPGLHPYCIADGLSASAADLLYAVKNHLVDSFKSYYGGDGVTYNEQLFLIGYSEGGYATLALHRELELNSSSYGLSVTASFPMAPPVSLVEVMLPSILEKNYPYGGLFFTPYILLAYMTYYPNSGAVADIFTSKFSDISRYYDGNFDSMTEVDPYIANLIQDSAVDIDDSYEVEHVENGSVTKIKTAKTYPVREMLLQSVQNELRNKDLSYPLYAYLADNDLAGGAPSTVTKWIPKAPIHFIHCDTDDLVFVENTKVAFDYYYALVPELVTADYVKPPILPASWWEWISEELLGGINHVINTVPCYRQCMITLEEKYLENNDGE